MILLALSLAIMQAQTTDGIPSPSAVVRYVNDCIAAVGPAATDLQMLEGRGWNSMNMRAKSGAPLPVASYSRAEDMTIVVASTAIAKSPSCMVMTPTNGQSRADVVRSALYEAFGSAAPSAANSPTLWRVDNHRIAVSPMPSSSNPMGLKIEVVLEK